MAPNGWSSFNDNGFSSFRESNPGATHLGELNLSGSRNIGPETSISLGSIYNNPSLPLTPTVDGDLVFEYHETGGSTQTGIVEYFGAHNNLVLVVNPDGQTYLQNQSTVGLQLDGYLITSASSSLNEAGWTSLASGDSDWTESNPADNHLGELNLDGSLFLAAESAAIDLGNAFAVGGERDLDFTFHVAGMGTFTGIVEYDEDVIEFEPSLPGDYDKNGIVEAADYNVWKQLFDTIGPSNADGNGDNVVDAADYTVWRDNLGATAGGSGSVAAVVPEPASRALLMAACAVLPLLGRRLR